MSSMRDTSYYLAVRAMWVSGECEKKTLSDSAQMEEVGRWSRNLFGLLLGIYVAVSCLWCHRAA